jgi:uncharacterized protein (DUF433 family)
LARYTVIPGGYTGSGIAPAKGLATELMRLDRIIADPTVMGGKPCVRGTRVTVGTIVGLVSAGHDTDKILAAYPYLTKDDIAQALAYAAWRSEEREVDLSHK